MKRKKLLKGQVVLEYILVIAAVVGMALIGYTLLKNKMKKPLATYKAKVESESATAGRESADSYYNKMEFFSK